MPLYTFHNEETGDTWEDMMSITGAESFLAENPNIKRIIYAPNFVSGIAGVTHKLDGGFRDVLSRVADANPHSPLAQEHGKKGIRETKVREVVNKHMNKP